MRIDLIVSWIILVNSILISGFILKRNHNKRSMLHNHNKNSVDNCDDAINGIGIDWNGTDTEINEKMYSCDNNDYENVFSVEEPYAEEHCKTPIPGYHVCIDEKIVYKERVPTSGPHRPVWVTYGEYLYMPPQRWVHAVEHGAAVFLYNPCADPNEIEYFKMLAKNCLRRHIITPYKNLPSDEKFNIVTFGCRLKLKKIFDQEKEIVNYLKYHAIKEGPEFHIPDDGSYNFGLIKKAELVSDLKDSHICPMF